jgi:hypothetical protein
LVAHEEEIDGEKRTVCGKCRDIACACCGKTKYKDGINKFSYEKDPDTGEHVYIGCCCTFVAGHMDVFKLYSEKYRNLKRSDPALAERMENDSRERSRAKASKINQPDIADRMIDNWAKRQAKNRKK